MDTTERAVDPAARLQHALDLGYRYLARRDHTVVEVRRHLAAKRVEPATIDEAVATLESERVLDDARYAARFAEDRRDLDGWGAERIERRLLSVGIGPEHVASALAAFGGADAEREAALDVLRRRLRVPPVDDRGRERALGLLVRRGYDLDLAYEVVREFAEAA